MALRKEFNDSGKFPFTEFYRVKPAEVGQFSTEVKFGVTQAVQPADREELGVTAGDTFTARRLSENLVVEEDNMTKYIAKGRFIAEMEPGVIWDVTNRVTGGGAAGFKPLDQPQPAAKASAAQLVS